MSNMIASSRQRLVLGLGATGQSVVRFFARQDIPCIAADARAELAGDATLRQLLPEHRLRFGELSPALVDSADEVIASPGVPLDHPLLQRAKALDIPIRGDIDLFMEQAKAPVIGITGSNGKSTVTALLGHLIAQAGYRVAVGGNLGQPALDLLDDAVDYYVLELSSFQLERSASLGLQVATVLNISPDHLDRHGTLANYQQAKHRIFRRAAAAVSRADDPLTTPLLAAGGRALRWRLAAPDLGEFGVAEHEGELWFYHGFKPLAPRSALALTGSHHTGNALAALALGCAADIDPELLARGLSSFTGLPHRCAPVAEVAGVRYINDSKATNVGATLAALAGLAADRSLILIAGGQGKGQDFSMLAAAIADHCKALILLGESAAEIHAAVGNAVDTGRVGTIDQAVSEASQLADSGDTVLLSPACASLDMFTSFAARGDAFNQAVTRLQQVDK